jgi:Flp pilus assembly protein TadG
MTRIRQALRSERGDSTIVGIVIVTALILMIGLVVDGGGKLQSDDQARYAAEQAARAAGQQINVAQAQAGDRPGVNLSQAVSAANSSLAASGVRGTVTSTPTGITVTATATYRTKHLPILGMRELTSTATAEARIARGITQEDS